MVTFASSPKNRDRCNEVAAEGREEQQRGVRLSPCRIAFHFLLSPSFAEQPFLPTLPLLSSTMRLADADSVAAAAFHCLPLHLFSLPAEQRGRRATATAMQRGSASSTTHSMHSSLQSNGGMKMSSGMQRRRGKRQQRNGSRFIQSSRRSRGEQRRAALQSTHCLPLT